MVVQLPENYYNNYRFIYYSLVSVNKEKIVTGTAQPQVTIDNLKNFCIPFSPLNEQKRIVAKLDKIIPRIDAVKERLEKIPVILKQFRQSILTAAVTGKLTEKWREEHPDVESTKNRISGNVEIIEHSEFVKKWNSFDIPDNWICIYLKEIAKMRLGKMLDSSKNTGNKVLYLRNVNVRWFNFDLEDLKELKIKNDELKKLSVEDGDVFICEGGVPGRSAVWKLGKNQLTFQKALHRVRFTIPMVSDWLVYNLKVDAYTQKLDELFTGSTIKHFTGRSLAIYPMPIPPVEEQKEIVRQVDKFFSLADRLEKQYLKSKSKIDKLSQSILAKAFRGELVITEAELAEKEGRDFESTEQLLERIQEEKKKMEEKLKKTRKIRKKKS